MSAKQWTSIHNSLHTLKIVKSLKNLFLRLRKHKYPPHMKFTLNTQESKNVKAAH